MRIIEKTIYEFSELKPEIQEKVIKEYYDAEDFLIENNIDGIVK